MRSRPAPAQRPAAVLACLAAAALLAGCGVRLETPPPVEPSPDAVEEVRQEAAVDAATIAETVAAVQPGAAEDPSTAVLQRVAADAEQHADALGGVWVAWPSGAPPEVETTPVSTEPPVASPAPADVLAALTEGAAAAREDALAATDDSLTAVLAAVSIARGHAAADLGGALGTPVAAAAGQPLPPEALLARGVDGPTVAVLDRARYAFETVAARSSGPTRDAATQRAAHLQRLVDTALANGAPDTREPDYDAPEPVEGLSPEQALAVDAETALLEHWVFSLTLESPEGREPLLAAAEFAAGQVRAWGGTLPALPGLPTE